MTWLSRPITEAISAADVMKICALEICPTQMHLYDEHAGPVLVAEVPEGSNITGK
jgi:hypothetical protein